MKDYRLNGLLILTAACILCTILLGCISSHVALTKELLSEYNLTSNDIKRLQLQLSDGILLEEETRSVDKDVDETHSLKKVEDRHIKQIVFKKGTSCIVTSSAADVLSVAFEIKDNLRFAYDRSHPEGAVYSYKPDLRTRTADSLDARPSGAGYAGWKKVGSEKYADSTFNVFISYHMPYLMVKAADLKKLVVESRDVPGMRQEDTQPEY